jgi:DNA-3-methyladenine glycosylase
VGRIVEVEAYIGSDDLASHARFGPTDRSRVMFGPPGIAYVYLVYGMYDCLNVVTEPDGRPAAVLIRAVEPLEGSDAMRAGRLAVAGRRRAAPAAGATQRDRLARLPAGRLASGPGLVAAAFGLERSHTGLDLLDPAGPVRLEAAPPGETAPRLVATPRVGIAYAGEPWTRRPWRLLDADSPAVSGPRPPS